MIIRRIILHHDTLGVTQPALLALRNELAARITHHIVVFEVPTAEAYCQTYGFFIVDLDVKEVAIIGDGFRSDEGGEGGAGHRAAQALLAIYGIKPEEALPEEAISYTDDESMYREPAEKMAELALEYDFKQPYFNKPGYVDWVFSKRFSH